MRILKVFLRTEFLRSSLIQNSSFDLSAAFGKRVHSKKRGKKTIPGGRDCFSLSALSVSKTQRVYRYFLHLTLNFTTSLLRLILMDLASFRLAVRRKSLISLICFGCIGRKTSKEHYKEIAHKNDMIALICRQKRSENGQENERYIYREMTITTLICRKRQNPENQQRKRCRTIKMHTDMAMAMVNRLIDRKKRSRIPDRERK